MEEKSNYEKYKEEIKEDIQNTGLSLFYMAGFFLLMLTIGMILFIVFDDYFNFSPVAKAITCIVVPVFAILLFVNKRLGNTVINLWMQFLCIVIILVLVGLAVGFLYFMFSSFFEKQPDYR